MTFVSYAQNFEDVLLWRALHDAEPKSYLDIGAQDPTLDSVSLAFYRAGWRGTHVEPTPCYATMLREARPDETVIQAAVSSSPGPLELHEFVDTGLSTGKPEIARMHLEQGFQSRTILVPTIRLDNLLERTGEVPWMKIDVEGMEGDVLESWGSSDVRPWILVIEATVPNSQVRSDLQWRDQVLSRGYKEVYFDGLSRYFVSKHKSRLADSFACPPNFFDDFNITYPHFAARDLVWVFEEHLRDSATKISQKEEAFEAQSELLQEATAAKAAQDEALQLAAVAERSLREKIETSAREMLAVVEELATFRERCTNLSAERQRLEREMQQLEQRRQEETSDLRQRLGEASAKVLAQDSRLSEANELVRIALAQPTDRWHRIGRALGVAREDRARQLLRSGLACHSHSKVQPTEFAMHIAPSREVRNPYLRADSLSELLSWDDVDFVRCAYVTILGRQPDATGEHHYTNRLRMGDSKYTILWQLRRSEEGPNHDPGIAGLDRSLKREALRRNRLFGWLVRGFLQGEGVSKQDRRFRQLQNRLAVVATQQSHQMDAVFAIQSQGSELVASLEKIAGDVARLAPHGFPMDLQRGNQSVASSSVRTTDDLDLSSRERAVLSSIQLAKY